MPRPKTIYVDRDELLRGIRRLTAETVAALTEARNARMAAGDCFHGADGVELDDIRDFGVRIDFVAFVDRGLTDSERLRHQQELRRMEGEGLVTIWGKPARRVKLTAAGLAKLEAKLEAKPAHG